MTRIKERLYKRFYDVDEAPIMSSEDIYLKASVSRNDIVSVLPKEPLPIFDVSAPDTILAFFEDYLTKPIQKPDIFMHIYANLNSAIPNFTSAQIYKALVLTLSHPLKDKSEKEVEDFVYNDKMHSTEFLYSKRHREIIHRYRMDYNTNIREGRASGIMWFLKKTLIALGWTKPYKDHYLNLINSDIVPSFNLFFTNLESAIISKLQEPEEAYNNKELLTMIAAYRQANCGTDTLFEAIGKQLMRNINDLDLEGIYKESLLESI